MTPVLGAGASAARRAPDPPRPATLAGHARIVRRGEALYDVGSPADRLYQVESGLLAISLPMRSGRDRIVSLAGPGELLGALLRGPGDHEERAEALSHTVTVIALARDAVGADLEPALLDALGRHASRLRRRIEDGDGPVADRVILTLLDLGARYGHAGEDGWTRLTLPLTHEHLAAMVGAARETTSAIVAELRRTGLLEGTRGRYRFVDAELRGTLSGAGRPR